MQNGVLSFANGKLGTSLLQHYNKHESNDSLNNIKMVIIDLVGLVPRILLLFTSL